MGLTSAFSACTARLTARCRLRTIWPWRRRCRRSRIMRASVSTARARGMSSAKASRTRVGSRCAPTHSKPEYSQCLQMCISMSAARTIGVPSGKALSTPRQVQVFTYTQQANSNHSIALLAHHACKRVCGQEPGVGGCRLVLSPYCFGQLEEMLDTCLGCEGDICCSVALCCLSKGVSPCDLCRHSLGA